MGNDEQRIVRTAESLRVGRYKWALALLTISFIQMNVPKLVDVPPNPFIYSEPVVLPVEVSTLVVAALVGYGLATAWQKVGLWTEALGVEDRA